MEPSKLSDVFCDNPYPGRGILLGLCLNGTHAALAYFIMGRSVNSRNRALERVGNDLAIRVLDENRMVDPSLILYTPLRTLESETVVTNGDQTDTICEAIENGGSFYEALLTRRFEPDAPHFTPRISGILRFGESFAYTLSILKAGDAAGTTALRQTFDVEPTAGTGHLIHTYRPGGDRLPSFSGEPTAVRLPNKIDELTSELWDALHPEHRVALYVRYTDIRTGEYEDRIQNQSVREDHRA
mgnify:CR=1 FL=1